MSNVNNTTGGTVLEGNAPPYTGGGNYPPPSYMLLLIGTVSGVGAGAWAYLHHCGPGIAALATLSGLTNFAVFLLLGSIRRHAGGYPGGHPGGHPR